MKIRLRLFATLRSFLPQECNGGETVIDLPDDAVIPDALAVFSVPVELPHIIFVNGRHVLRPNLADFHLKEGDILAAFPAIGGG